jgi:subtilisin family serine protease
MDLKLKRLVLRLPPNAAAGAPGKITYHSLPSDENAVTSTAQADEQVETLQLETHDLSDGETAEISSESGIVAVGIAMPFTLIDPVATTAQDPGGDSWGIADIGADALDATAGAGARVAVLDTGISSHPAFDGLEPEVMNFTDEEDHDVHGHGTHCAGTIFGQNVDGRRIGIARGIRKPLIGKVLGQRGGDSESIMQAILWAQRRKAQVISMSLGIDFPGFQRRLMQSGLRDVEATSIALMAYRENVRLFDQIADMFANDTVAGAPLLIAAAGNESNRNDYTIATAPPAIADGILSIAAIDRHQQIAHFSNTHADCCAPGVDIVSAALGGGLSMKSGTSMATPHVAGLAAVEAQKLAQGGAFTAADLRVAVLAKAVGISALSRLDVGRGKIMHA